MGDSPPSPLGYISIKLHKACHPSLEYPTLNNAMFNLIILLGHTQKQLAFQRKLNKPRNDIVPDCKLCRTFTWEQSTNYFIRN